MAKTSDILNEKDSEIVKRVASGQTLAQVGREVLGETKYPSQYIYRRLQRPKLRGKLLQQLEEQGITDIKVVRLLRQLLGAKKLKSIRLEGGSGKVKLKVEDWEARAKALDFIFKIRGDFAPQQIEIRRALNVQEIIVGVLHKIAESCPHCREIIHGELVRIGEVMVEEDSG